MLITKKISLWLHIIKTAIYFGPGQSSTIYSSGNAVKFTNTEKLAIIADYSFGFTLGGKSGGDGVSNKRYPLYISANKNGTVDWVKTLGQTDWAYCQGFSH